MRGRASTRPLLFSPHLRCQLRIQGMHNVELVPKNPKMSLGVLSLAVLSLLSPGGEAQKQKQPEGYTLIWSDEFNGKNGSQPDPSKWTYDVGGNGWGNHELEYYTSRRENARIENGNLVITAREEPYRGPNGTDFDYTSARLTTQGLFSQTYGRFEARIKL